MNLLEIKRNIKNKFKAIIKTNKKFGNDSGFELGQVHKIKSNGDLDDKEFFHYNPKLLDNINIFDEGLEIKNFFKNLNNLYSQIDKFTKKIILKLNEEYPNIYNSVYDSENNSNCVLRLLKYTTKKNNTFCAKGHFDKGIATIALAESNSGLRIGENKKKLMEIEYIKDYVIFFPSLLIPNYTQNKLKPTWHDVIQNTNSSNSDEFVRWAIVYFINPLKINSEISFEEAHNGE